MRAITEPEDYGIVDPLKEAEDARLQAWDDFVALMRTELERQTLPALLYDVGVAYAAVVSINSLHQPARQIYDFAEEHGWPDTLRAIAAAMQADERHKRELMDRR